MREEKDEVSEIMTKTVYALTPEARVGDALKLMANHDIGSVVVTKLGRPVGIITERDIVRIVAKNPRHLSKRIREISSKTLITIGPKTSMIEALSIMSRNKIRRLPVVDGDSLEGIVTERDLLRWVVKIAYEPGTPTESKDIIVQAQ
jgi:CBS domain-containing protein